MHHPPLSTNKDNNTKFMDELATYMSVTSGQNKNIFLLEDFNMQVNHIDNPGAQQFINMLEE